ncbi:hypothetical protein FA15DRAFT_698640 [Coprinopsis marcescibilis]|uniref:Uncharacterized protein n=1 Tax=Coprinopsis marcescibilis TaxID=230819 RepID=A0A5C3K9Z3_COPMA|nr:hypothetical protein FA15DRAFT_698640 [Coprinopsis marcescibilis]
MNYTSFWKARRKHFHQHLGPMQMEIYRPIVEDQTLNMRILNTSDLRKTIRITVNVLASGAADFQRMGMKWLLEEMDLNGYKRTVKINAHDDDVNKSEERNKPGCVLVKTFRREPPSKEEKDFG